MGVLTVLVLTALGIWLWRRKTQARKSVAQSTEGNLLQAIRNGPSYQIYSEKFSKIFGESFDKLSERLREKAFLNKEKT